MGELAVLNYGVYGFVIGRSGYIAGVGRLYVAYPYIGAMLRPVIRDKHERDILPRLFLFP